MNGYDGRHPGKTTLLKKGSTREGWEGERTRALESDILLDHDVELVMRDGAKLYCDVYRPADSADEKIPALLMWSPYGKRYSSVDMLPVTTWRCGLKSSDLSGWEKFEGLDPATWCPRGYAIVSIDTRGAGHSDGENQIMGARMGEDGYDAIEALAKMPWCDGNIGMAGNSVGPCSRFPLRSTRPSLTYRLTLYSSSPSRNGTSPRSNRLRSRQLLPGKAAETSSGSSLCAAACSRSAIWT